MKKKMLIILQKDDFDLIFYEDFKNKIVTIDLQEFKTFNSVNISLIALILKKAESVKLINVSDHIKYILNITGIFNNKNLEVI